MDPQMLVHLALQAISVSSAPLNKVEELPCLEASTLILSLSLRLALFRLCRACSSESMST